MMKSLLREPLAHFLLLAGLLFLIAGRQDGGGDLSRRIEVAPQRVEQLRTVFEQTWQHHG